MEMVLTTIIVRDISVTIGLENLLTDHSEEELIEHFIDYFKSFLSDVYRINEEDSISGEFWEDFYLTIDIKNVENKHEQRIRKRFKGNVWFEQITKKKQMCVDL